jgi:hypothetical protein
MDFGSQSLSLCGHRADLLTQRSQYQPGPVSKEMLGYDPWA